MSALNIEVAKRDRATKELTDAHSSLELRIEERTEELNDNQKRFQSFAEAASDWFWELDADLRCTYVSPSVEESLGVAAESLLGRSIAEFSHEGKPDEEWKKLIEMAHKQLPVHSHESRHVSPNGAEIF